MTRHIPVAPERLALQRLYHWQRTAPEQIVLTQPIGGGAVRDFTWRQAIDETRRIAAYLRSLGIGPGDQVALMSKNTAWWLFADWAIWMAGAVSVPLYPTLAAETIRQILVHSESKLLFIGKLDGWEAMQPGVPPGLRCVTMPLAPPDAMPGAADWAAIVESTPPLAGDPVRDADDLATIIYTSGTTGLPKGVMHSFGAFAWAVEAGLKRSGGMDAGARVLSYLPLSHVAERILIEHGLLATGIHVFFAESLDTFLKDLQRARPTAFFSVPRLWLKFQQGVHSRIAPRRLDWLLRIPLLRRIVRKKVLGAIGLDECLFAGCGAASMPPDLLRWYGRLGLSFVEAYGMTENCATSHATLPGRPRPGTVGLPYEGVEARLDPADREVQVRSPANMLGYFKAPELTAAAFTADGWLRTGDQGELDAEGNLRITGRLTEWFKTSKGKFVAPAPIEDQLVMHPAIEACCVAGANLGQPLGLVMLGTEAAAGARDGAARAAIEASLAAHLQALNARLDPHERLAALVVVSEPWTVDNGFVTPTLKVKRNRIEQAYASRFEGWLATGRRVVWMD